MSRPGNSIGQISALLESTLTTETKKYISVTRIILRVEMEIPELIVACVSLLAVVAHVLGGTRETAAIRPSGHDEKLTAHWIQAMCAFQMLSVDLLAVSLLLFAIAFWDLGPSEETYVLLLSLLFFLWGTVWAFQAWWIKKTPQYLFRLPHWVVWFACSGLLYWGTHA